MSTALEQNYSKSILPREFMPGILFLFGSHAFLTPWEVDNAQLPRDSELVRLLETPRPVRECILIIYLVSPN